MEQNNESKYILAGDVGGTNINLAIIEMSGSHPSIVLNRRYSTQEEKSLEAPVIRFLDEYKISGFTKVPLACCISGAGAVVNRRVRLTNASWAIDGDELQKAIKIPTKIINDFSAISWGVLGLDTHDPNQVTVLEHPDGSSPEPVKGTIGIVGAGTGLGVSCIVQNDATQYVLPSEGGHTTLPVYDDRTRRLQKWLESKYGFVPGAEAAISGQGIANIFEFLIKSEEISSEEALSILDSPYSSRPALISEASGKDPVAGTAMSIFVELYARRASDLAAMLLPRGGIFLAGGIAAKNEKLFIENYRFMNMFEKNYAPHIKTILEKTPVMIIRDYSISLYGAARAALEPGI